MVLKAMEGRRMRESNWQLDFLPLFLLDFIYNFSENDVDKWDGGGGKLAVGGAWNGRSFQALFFVHLFSSPEEICQNGLNSSHFPPFVHSKFFKLDLVPAISHFLCNLICGPSGFYPDIVCAIEYFKGNSIIFDVNTNLNNGISVIFQAKSPS